MGTSVCIRIVGNSLGGEDLEELTRALYRRLALLDDIEVQVPTKLAPHGAKSGEWITVTGSILFFLANALAEETAREAIRRTAHTIAEFIHYWREKGRDVSVKIEAPDEQPVHLESENIDEEAACKALTKAGPRPKYALLIGSGSFKIGSGIKNLSYVEEDIDKLRNLLLSFPNDFSPESVSTIVDRPDSEVLNRIQDMLEAARGSTLVLYYSGHGKVDGKSRDFYLTASNSSERRLSISAIEFRKIVDLIKENRTRQVGILLDCCYAGTAVANIKGSIQDQLSALVANSDKDIYLIGASTATQVAFEKPEHGLSAMTKVIVDGLRSGRADVSKRGRVSFDDLYEYISENIGTIASQRPIRSVLGVGTGPILVHAQHPDLVLGGTQPSNTPQSVFDRSETDLRSRMPYRRTLRSRLRQIIERGIALGSVALSHLRQSGTKLLFGLSRLSRNGASLLKTTALSVLWEGLKASKAILMWFAVSSTAHNLVTIFVAVVVVLGVSLTPESTSVDVEPVSSRPPVDSGQSTKSFEDLIRSSNGPLLLGSPELYAGGPSLKWESTPGWPVPNLKWEPTPDRPVLSTDWPEPTPVWPKSSYSVQVSSQSSESDARNAYKSLQTKYPQELGSYEAVIHRADLGDKGVYYRALVGPFDSGEAAFEMCSRLKAAGGSCIIQRY
jgi:hypothetical protein